MPGTAAIIAGLQQEVRQEVEHLRPAVVRLDAGCRDGVQDRRARTARPRAPRCGKNIRAVKIPNSLLGITISFDKHGDVPAAKFYVSQIQSDGSHKLVG